MLKGDWRGRGLFFLQIHYEGLGGGVFGGRRRGKGVSFFRKTFFPLLNGLGRGCQGFFFFDMLKVDGRGNGFI
jgi:hypothetical protein